MTVGENLPRSAAGAGAAHSSGNLTTSNARARCGNRLINPRSSSPLTRRWMPDLDLRFKASFISSKDGETPVAVSRWLMNSNSSRCFLVSMRPPSALQNEP